MFILVQKSVEDTLIFKYIPNIFQNNEKMEAKLAVQVLSARVTNALISLSRIYPEFLEALATARFHNKER